MAKRHLLTITNSEVETWRSCRARWGFEYAERLRPRVKATPLRFGTVYHAGAAAGWRAAWGVKEASVGTRLERAIPAAIKGAADETARFLHGLGLMREELVPEDAEALEAEAREHLETAAWCLEHYFQVKQSDLERVPLAIETPFKARIPDRLGRPSVLVQDGVFDLVLWDPRENLLELQDHKTTRYGVSLLEGRLPLLTQPTGYLLALDRLMKTRGVGWGQTPDAARAVLLESAERIAELEVGAVAFNVVRRSRPSTPKVNKLAKKWATLPYQQELLAAQEAGGPNAGEVSVAEIDTTAEIYGDALIEQVTERGLAITDKQKARHEGLKARGDGWFAQFEFYRGRREFERWRGEMWVESRGIRAALKDEGLRTRNPGACTTPGTSACPFASVCSDPDDPTIRSRFRQASDRHEEVREAEAHGGEERDGKPGAAHQRGHEGARG